MSDETHFRQTAGAWGVSGRSSRDHPTACSSHITCSKPCSTVFDDRDARHRPDSRLRPRSHASFSPPSSASEGERTESRRFAHARSPRCRHAAWSRSAAAVFPFTRKPTPFTEKSPPACERHFPNTDSYVLVSVRRTAHAACGLFLGYRRCECFRASVRARRSSSP